MNWCCSYFMMIWIWIRNIQGIMMIVIYFSVLRCLIVAAMLVSVWVMGLLGMTKPGSVVRLVIVKHTGQQITDVCLHVVIVSEPPVVTMGGGVVTVTSVGVSVSLTVAPVAGPVVLGRSWWRQQRRELLKLSTQLPNQ